MMRSRLLPTLLLLWLGLSPHLSGQQAEPDSKAFERLKANAEKGDAEAQYQLGLLYANGTGVSRSLTKAAKWTHKAADQGHARAEYQLGWDYTAGEGVKTNLTEAARWIRLAAEHGLIEAEFEMGLRCLNGRGVEANGAEAVDWFRKAAALGSVTLRAPGYREVSKRASNGFEPLPSEDLRLPRISLLCVMKGAKECPGT